MPRTNIEHGAVVMKQVVLRRKKKASGLTPLGEAMRRLGAKLPDDAATMTPAVLLRAARWPSHDFEPVRSTFWSTPLSFHEMSPHSGNADEPWHEEYEDEGRVAPYWQVGTTKYGELLMCADADAEADPEVFFFLPDEGAEDMASMPLSQLLGILRAVPSVTAERPELAPVTPALEQLIEVIERPNAARVAEAIADGEDPNALFERRGVIECPLSLALRGPCRAGTATVVKTLLDAGADPNGPMVIDAILERKAEGTDDFHRALADLFERGARIDPAHPASTLPVQWAEVRSLALMIDHGLDVNATSASALVGGFELSSLCFAIDRGDVERTKLLVERGADVDYVVPSFEVTPLHFAVATSEERRARELVELLLAGGARCRRSTRLPDKWRTGSSRRGGESSLTPRELASQLGRHDVAKLLPDD